MRNRGWAPACLLGLGLLVMLAPAWAQSVTPDQEYKKLIRVDQNIQPLGAHPFGANISLYNGSLSFVQTDVSLKGNGPVLQLSRDFQIHDSPAYALGRPQQAFGDWNLDLPRIATLTAVRGGTEGAEGWLVGMSDVPRNTQRCTDFEAPPAVTETSSGTNWLPSSWWYGDHLIIPGQGSQDLLENTGSDDATYPAVTKQHWRISCIAETQTANGQPGQGFIAWAPNGTRYWFNELVYRYAPPLTRAVGSGTVTDADVPPLHPQSLLAAQRVWLGKLIGDLTGSPPAEALPSSAILTRHMTWMLVTKVEDRFGNWLKYSYNADGYLTAITASDGRKLTVQYVSGTNRIQSVTLEPANAAPRVWTYSYTGSADTVQLSAVTLPDGSQWHFDLGAFDNAGSIGDLQDGTCDVVAIPADAGDSVTGSMTQPSGLQGSFTVEMDEHGRSYSPHDCVSPSGPTAPGSYALTPDLWYAFTLTQKAFTGAGLPSAGEIWKFSYSAPNGNWSNCTGTCPTTVWTQVLNPDNSSIRYTFSNRWNYTESQLLQTDFYSGNDTGLLRSVANTYAAPTGQAWPASLGDNPQSRINSAQTTQRSPLQKRVISQDSNTYTWQALAFNSYAQVTEDQQSNSIAGQTAVEDATTYQNDTIYWVLALPLTHKNVTTGKTVVANTYNSLDLLTARSHFGEPMMTYTWNTAGQLASFTDGDSHTTTLGDYMRGIPQTIGYPDGTSQHLTVNDFGEITAITNQAGDTTDYAYDAAGRLTQITYPTGGTAWYPTTFQYQYVGSANGLTGDHWDRTVSQGAARHVTTYDALLRPVLTDTYIDGDSSSHISAEKEYNWKGLTTFQSWPVTGSPSWGASALAAGTTTTYDALGRVTATSHPADIGSSTTTTPVTTEIAYLSGNRKQVTGPKGNVTTTSYQVFDEPSYKAVIQVQTPAGITQTITRNLYGQPTAIAQSGGGISSTRDYFYYPESSQNHSPQRLCRTYEPETGSTLLSYDLAGNLIGSAEGQSVSSGCGTLPSSPIVRTYDAMNRLLTVTYPDGDGNEATTYNAMGQVTKTTASTSIGAVTWADTYDNRGHLTSKTLGIGSYSWPIDYAYDDYGYPSQITYPDSKQVAFAPDALGRPTEAGPYATGVSYYPDGTLEHFVYMGGKDDYLAEQNAQHALKNLTVGNGSTSLYSEDFDYDKAGNITAMDDLTNAGTRSETLTYDALNRLTQAVAPQLWGTATYAYDALNNLTQLTVGGVPHTYSYADNRLTGIKDGSTVLDTFGYDARGDVTLKNSQSRVFDDAHRLLQIPGVASYVYDAAGRRVEKALVGGDTTYYAYGAAGHLLYQFNATTGANTDYVYLGKHLVAELQRPKGAPVVNPAGVSVSATPNNGSYTLSWAATSGATYTLQEQINGGGWSTIQSDAATSKAESGKAGGTYGYRLQVCNGDCSDWSAPTTVGVTPAKPTITIPSGDQKAAYTISWTQPSSTTSFLVQEQVNGGSWTTVYSGTATSTQRPGTSNGSYVYRVEANNAYGNRGWVTSGTVTVLHPPAAAPSLSVPGTSSTGGYTVSWGSVANATSYTLQQQTNGGSWSTQYTGANRSQPFSGKTNGAKYGYRVEACNAAGCGPWSSTHTIAIAIPPPAPTGVYTDKRVPKTGLISLTIVWNGVSGASSYQILDVRTGNVITGLTGTSYSLYSGVTINEPTTAGDEHAVRSCNPYACSAWVVAPVRAIITKQPYLSVPSGSISGSYTVSWGAVPYATSYTLQQQTNGGGWGTVYSGGGTSNAFSGKGNGTYGYRVEACNTAGCSGWSNTGSVAVFILGRVSGLTSSVVWTEMTAASGYVASPLTSPTGMQPDMKKPPPPGSYYWILHARWNAVSGATYYNVKYDQPAGHTMTTYYIGRGSYVTLGAVYPPDRRIMTSSTGITVYAQACDASGCSAWVGPVTPTVVN